MKSFVSTIRKFIKQAEEGKSLKVKDYPKQYAGLNVEVSFGFGTVAIVPWIAFLYDGQTTSNGIFPVYLYYPHQETLILAYGVSEANSPGINWELPETVQTVTDYFTSNHLGSPQRYGSSFVFKAYSPVSEIDNIELERDLEQIISVYEELMEHTFNLRDVCVNYQESFTVERLKEIQDTGLLYSPELLNRYAVSLLTKPFVILTGLSGSGKTRLALTFAKWISSEKQVKIIAVGADWNNREYLLGYPNSLERGKYIKPENGVLDFIIEASRNPSYPYFLILDEMNLSYVERYFADFLSSMESGEFIHLHPETPEWKECDIPAKIKLPSNLFITGTINVDETTYMFSPKVLDRANVIEFRISEVEMSKFLDNSSPLIPEAVNRKGADMGYHFVKISKEKFFVKNAGFNDMLLTLFKELKEAGSEFGYRTASEIYQFATLAQKLNTGWSIEQIMDIAVMQKMLPKLHGSRKKLYPVLTSLWKLSLKMEYQKEKLVKLEDQTVNIDKVHFRFPLSAAKIRQMYKNASDNGFTSYAEA